MSGADVIEDFKLDAVGVEDADAPAGVGAWGTADSDTGGTGLAKFNLMIPMFDFMDLLDPAQQAMLESAPWRPPAGWLGDIAVSELAEISYWTKTPAEENGTPFYLVLYTQPDGVGDHAVWYGHRLTGRKSAEVEEPGGVWTKWTISDAANQIVFIDQPVTGTFSGSGLPTLPELVAETSFNWSEVDDSWTATSIDYGAELMRYVSLQTASGTATTESNGLIDLIEIRLTDGRELVIDLEP